MQIEHVDPGTEELRYVEGTMDEQHDDGTTRCAFVEIEPNLFLEVRPIEINPESKTALREWATGTEEREKKKKFSPMRITGRFLFLYESSGYLTNIEVHTI